MPGAWDTHTKRLVGENPEHFVGWLIPRAEFKEKAHLTQFYVDRNEMDRATKMQEKWVKDLDKRAVSSSMRGIALYNLACFYATTNETEKALEVLRQALLLDPDLAKWSKQDPDLASLR